MTGVGWSPVPPSCSGPTERRAEHHTSRLLRLGRQEMGRRDAVGGGRASAAVSGLRSSFEPTRAAFAASRSRYPRADATRSRGARRAIRRRLDPAPPLPLHALLGRARGRPSRRPPAASLRRGRRRSGASPVVDRRSVGCGSPLPGQPVRCGRPRRPTRLALASTLGPRLSVDRGEPTRHGTREGSADGAAPRRVRVGDRAADHTRMHRGAAGVMRIVDATPTIRGPPPRVVAADPAAVASCRHPTKGR